MSLKDVDRWAGLSGGPLFANGLIFAAMREVPYGWKGDAIEAEPQAPLLRDETDGSLHTLLGVRPVDASSDPEQARLCAASSVIGEEAYAASSSVHDSVAAQPFWPFRLG